MSAIAPTRRSDALFEQIQLLDRMRHETADWAHPPVHAMNQLREQILTEVVAQLRAGDSEDYSQDAAFFLASIEDPILLRQAIGRFTDHPGALRDHFYRVAIRQLKRLHLFQKDREIAMPLLTALRQARAPMTCRRIWQEALQRLQSEVDEVRQIRARYLNGPKEEMERLIKRGAPQPLLLRLDPKTAIVAGRVWELATYYMARGYRVAFSAQSIQNTALVDLINVLRAQRLPHRVHPLNMAQRHAVRCRPIELIKRLLSQEGHDDHRHSSEVLSCSCWLPDRTPMESALHYCALNQNVTVPTFIAEECPHKASCRDNCTLMRGGLNRLLRNLGKQREEQSSCGVIHLLAIRPEDWDRLMFQTHPMGKPCDDGPAGPRAGEELNEPGWCRHYCIPQWRAMAKRLPIERRARVLRVSCLLPEQEAAWLPPVRAIATALTSYDKQHVGLSNEQQLALGHKLLEEAQAATAIDRGDVKLQ
jgi:hypothetical protein